MSCSVLQKTTAKVLTLVVGVLFAIIRFIIFRIYSLTKCRKSCRLPSITNQVLRKPAYQLAADIRERKITSEEVVRAYILRMQEVNPIINSVVDFRFEKAIDDAMAVDKRIVNGWLTKESMEQETPLLGVPITIKESFAVEGIRQTLGLTVRKEMKADKDAEVVRLMKEAGAIVIGVTNLPELCSSMDTYNKVYGQTKNPYDTRRSPGGSSGGEASIIAAAGSVLGIGTDLVGSIRIPAMMNGIFGHKPTQYSVSLDGLYPPITGEFLRLFTAGPLARYAADLKMAMRVITYSSVIRQRLQQTVDMKTLRVFYIADQTDAFFIPPVDSDVLTAQQKVIKYLRVTHGIEAKKFSFPEISELYSAVVGHGHHHYPCSLSEEITNRKGRARLWWEILKSMCFCSTHTYTMLGYCIIYDIMDKLNTPYDSEVTPFLNKLVTRFQELLTDDVILLMPTFPVSAWPYALDTFYESGFPYSSLANVLGIPATHFPVELNKEGLPVGLQVVAGQNNDHLCLAFAEEMERAFGGWVAPPSAKK